MHGGCTHIHQYITLVKIRIQMSNKIIQLKGSHNQLSTFKTLRVEAVKHYVPLKTPLCFLNMSDFEIIKLAGHVYKLLHGLRAIDREIIMSLVTKHRWSRRGNIYIWILTITELITDPTKLHKHTKKQKNKNTNKHASTQSLGE